jgi:hypothetical protein
MPRRQAKTQPRRFLAPKGAKTALQFGEQRIDGIWKYDRGVLVLCVLGQRVWLQTIPLRRQ